MPNPIAIATADWHIWSKKPVWRSIEPDWFEAMKRPLSELKKIQEENGNIPVLIGGDIFDHSNPPPEAINFLLENMPENVIAVPGQHDLENHVLENIKKTAFWTLKKAGKINYSSSKNILIDSVAKLVIYFASWGADLSKIEKVKADPNFKHILLCHKYVWFDDTTKYGGQEKPEGKLIGLRKFLQQFDFAVFGDNHIPFRKKIGKCQVINCGTLIRRKLDERDYNTGCTILYDDGSISFQEFDTTKDLYLQVREEDKEENSLNISSRKFMEELESMDADEIDYQQEIEKKLDEIENREMNKIFGEIFKEYEGAKK